MPLKDNYNATKTKEIFFSILFLLKKNDIPPYTLVFPHPGLVWGLLLEVMPWYHRETL